VYIIGGFDPSVIEVIDTEKLAISVMTNLNGTDVNIPTVTNDSLLTHIYIVNSFASFPPLSIYFLVKK
jgi:hypothetical protein